MVQKLGKKRLFTFVLAATLVLSGLAQNVYAMEAPETGSDTTTSQVVDAGGDIAVDSSLPYVPENEASLPELVDDASQTQQEPEATDEEQSGHAEEEDSASLEDLVEEDEEAAEPDILAAGLLLGANATLMYNRAQQAINDAMSASSDVVVTFDEGVDSFEFTKALEIRGSITRDVTITLRSDNPLTLYNGTTRHINVTGLPKGKKVTLVFENITLDGMGTSGGIYCYYSEPCLAVRGLVAVNSLPQDEWVGGGTPSGFVFISNPTPGANDVYTGSLEVYDSRIDGIASDGSLGAYTGIVASFLDTVHVEDVDIRNLGKGAVTTIYSTNFFASGTFVNNQRSSGVDGGAIAAGACINVRIEGVFIGNKGYRGGAIDVSTAGNGFPTKIAEISGHFENNISTYKGGAISATLNTNGGIGRYVEDLYIHDATFVGNTAAYEGGAVASPYSYPVSGGPVYANPLVRMVDCEFENNSVTRNAPQVMGGAVNTYVDEASYTRCTFKNNSVISTMEGAQTFGGGIFSWDKKLTLTDCTFGPGNSAFAGGGLYSNGTPLTVTGGSFTGNDAMYGGGLYATTTSTVVIDGVTFQGNTSENADGIGYGAGAYIVAEGGATITGASKFIGNRAGWGAGVYLRRGTLDVTGTTAFTGNTAPGGGGAICAPPLDFDTETILEYLENLTVGSGVTFSGNLADEGYHLADAEGLALHETNIASTVFSAPFTKGYNNYDIFYNEGLLAVELTVPYEYNYVGAPAGEYHSETLYTGEKLTEPAEPGREGYRFTGWYTDAGCAEATKWSFADEVWDAMTLYAGWQRNSYTVEFRAGDGVTSPANETVPFGTKVPKPADPNKEGHSFHGWFSALTGGSRWDFDALMPAHNMVLYAQYSLNSYELGLDYNDGSDVRVSRLDFGASVPRPATPQRAGYEFTGWTLEGTAYVFEGATMPARNITLVAGWRRVSTPPPVTTTTSRGGGGGGGNTSSATPSTSVPTTTSVASASSSSSSSSSAVAEVSSAPPPSSAVATEAPSEPEPVAPVDELAESGLDQGSVTFGGIPLGGLGSTAGWSLFNLVVALLMLLSAVLLVLRTIRDSKRDKAYDKGRFNDLERSTSDVRQARVFTGLAIGFGVLPLLLFPILESFTDMILFSRWTPLTLILLVCHAGCCILTAIRRTSRQ